MTAVSAIAEAVAAAAQIAHTAGLAPWPPREDGSKAPVGEWGAYHRRRPTLAELAGYYPGCTGVGIVCGAKPDDPDPVVAALAPVEALDIDDPTIYPAIAEAAEALGLLRLLDSIEAGYCDRTPGGIRWLYRCATVAGNTKLARRPATAEELAADPDTKIKTLIETRGTGGYAIVAPSNGKVHPSGQAYRRVSGDFASIREITPEDRAALFSLLRTFDAMPAAAPKPEPEPARASAGVRPGDDYTARTTWPELLEPAGWRALYTRSDGVTLWQRPGKQGPGASATTNVGGSDLLYVFSTSTDFEAERGYSRFGAYAVLHHGGECARAAAALAAQGYGSKAGATAAAPEEAVAGVGLPADRLADAVVVAAEGQRIAAEGVPYVVDRLIPAYGMLGFVVAYSKVGKTTFGQALGTAVATGVPFLERGTRRSRVLIVAAEDPPEYTAYLARHLRVPSGCLTYYRGPVRLDPAGLSQIQTTVEDGGYGLVLIASWQAVVRGLIRDENDNAGAVQIVEAVKATTRECGVPWLIDAHAGKGEDQSDDADPTRALRGASGASGAADYVVSLRYAQGTFGTQRRLSARGRFVLLEPTLIDFDPDTGSYSLIGRAKNAAAETTWRLICETGALTTEPQSAAAIARRIGFVDDAGQATRVHRRQIATALRHRPDVLLSETWVRGGKATLYRRTGSNPDTGGTP